MNIISAIIKLIMAKDNIMKILDSRTPFQASENYRIAKHNEKVTATGFGTVLGMRVGRDNYEWEKIDEEEKWLDGKVHIRPDYYLYIDRDGEIKKWTIEIKTTSYDSFLDDEIIVKAPQVWTCKNHPDKFPNPYVLVATNQRFALIKMASFWNYPRKKKFGEIVKDCFVLNVKDYEWHEFLVPLKFKTKGDNGDY